MSLNGRIRSLYTAAAFVLLLVCACQRRPLETNVTINLNLNIHLNVEVNGEMETLPEPEMIRVMFFNPKTYDLVTESYLSSTRGRINLPPGKYKFIAYNFDTESTLLRNDQNYYSIEAYTNEVSKAMRSKMLNIVRYGKSAGTKTDDEDWDDAIEQLQNNPIIYEPDHLFVSHQDVEVLSINEDQTIEAEAETWKISVRIKNEQYMASASALITGQIASNFIGLPKEEGKTDTDVTLMFDMEAGSDKEDNDIVVGKFNTFGKNPSAESRLWLTIILKTIDGESLEWHRDITDEFLSLEALEDKTIHIEEEIDIPKPENPGINGNGGFQPGVDDWQVEDIPINI